MTGGATDGQTNNWPNSGDQPRSVRRLVGCWTLAVLAGLLERGWVVSYQPGSWFWPFQLMLYRYPADVGELGRGARARGQAQVLLRLSVRRPAAASAVTPVAGRFRWWWQGVAMTRQRRLDSTSPHGASAAFGTHKSRHQDVTLALPCLGQQSPQAIRGRLLSQCVQAVGIEDQRRAGRPAAMLGLSSASSNAATASART